MPLTKPIGIFGGAFAPFHNGHLRLAIEARERLALREVRLVPTAHPPHRPDSRISPQRRYDWVQLAVRRERYLVPDDREIRREGPSFTIETLSELRAQLPEAPLVLLMGADAFAHLHTWHRWGEILTLAHLAIVSRPGTLLEPSNETAALLSGRQARDAAEFRAQPGGAWMQLDLPLLDISSTRIRRLLKAGHSVRGLVPDAILNAMTAADIAALTRDD
ncbi:MAG TPA: nicotinate-nucleotide adenylyltransferase, partial [Solimonas sp.]|nr:nicotinate-nucleotide adenylyltransferase [Solimonas sp.]